MAKNTKITIQDIEVRVFKHSSGEDYICLTDIAKQANSRSEIVIQNWMRNAGTLDFLKEWELLYNDLAFKHIEFDVFRKKAGTPAFVMSPKQWVEKTDAIGIFSKKGRYGGTYAHKDIAFEFCSAISARFKLVLIKEFQRLKEDEALRLGNPWSIRREITKANYQILADSIKSQLVPKQLQGTKKEGLYFATEADLLNNVVFGMTAKQFKNKEPRAKGNLRDSASVIDLLILANLEALNSRLIHWDCDMEQRYQLLAESAVDFRKTLEKSAAVQRIENQSNNTKLIG
jgi:hypothetical protein